MIDILKSNITDIMPGSLKNIPEVQAMGYAISRMLQRILAFSQVSGVHAVIDKLPEDAVDLLAVELRSKYYGDLLSLDEKREIVKKTLLWHYKAGTFYTVQELVDFIFEDASAEEWFSYGADPYLFRIWANIRSKGISTEQFLEFLKAMYEVKNTRSHLEAVIFHYHTEAKAKAVAAAGIGCDLKVKARVAEEIYAHGKNHGVVAISIEQSLGIKPIGSDAGSDLGSVYALTSAGQKVNVLTVDGIPVRTG